VNRKKNSNQLQECKPKFYSGGQQLMWQTSHIGYNAYDLDSADSSDFIVVYTLL